MRVTFCVNKSKVLDDVGRMTAYIGQRKVGDVGAFERISTTDSDNDMLEQFWLAACSAATDILKHAVIDSKTSPDYKIVCEVSSLYDFDLTDSINDSLHNFFVTLMASKWCGITSPDDVKRLAEEAAGYAIDVNNKFYHRKMPQRLTTKDRNNELPQVHIY